MQVVGRSHEIILSRKVRCVDDERLPLPSSHGIAFPLADGRRQARAPVQLDDARFMHGLEEQQDPRRGLYDLVIAKRPGAGVGSAESRHTVRQAAFDMGEIFRSLGWTLSEVRLSNSRSIISNVVPVAVALLKRSISASAARKTASPPAKSALVFLNRRSARLRSSATSSSVKNCLPSSAFGRSSGVALLFNQTPCSSG